MRKVFKLYSAIFFMLVANEDFLSLAELYSVWKFKFCHEHDYFTTRGAAGFCYQQRSGPFYFSNISTSQFRNHIFRGYCTSPRKSTSYPKLNAIPQRKQDLAKGGHLICCTLDFDFAGAEVLRPGGL